MTERFTTSKKIDDRDGRSFKVIDGDSFWDKKEKFKELYNKNVSMKEIREILNLSIAQYNKLVKECGQERSIIPRRKKSLGVL